MTDGQGRSFAHRNRTSHEDKTPLDTRRVSFNRVVNGTQRRGDDQPATAYMQRTCDCEIQIDFNLRGTWTSWKCHFCVNGTWQFIIIASHMVVTHVITSDSTGRAFKVHSLIEFCYLPSCLAGSSQLETSSRVPTVINRTHTFCVLLVHK